MKFFVDTADVAAIRELNDLGMVDGVTTNRSPDGDGPKAPATSQRTRIPSALSVAAIDRPPSKPYETL